MKHRVQRDGTAPLAILLLSMLLISCGGGNSGPTAAPAMPAFGSTPVTAAVEGSAYTYQVAATDPAGGTVRLALTAAPVGATLTGTTVSWTPTAAQSRAANNFTVTATTASGGSATQSWTVTPNGTVRIGRTDTFWNQTGSTDMPFPWKALAGVIVLVPQADGSFQSLTGSADADGIFEVPNVPAGYYWLQIAPTETYWTSSSNFDDGENIYSRTLTTTPTDSTTTLDLDFTGLDQVTSDGWMEFMLRDTIASNLSSLAAGSNAFTGMFRTEGNIDYSGFRNAFALQYEPVDLGNTNGFALGPELTISDLSLANGAVNTISGALNPSVPKQMNLTLDSSAWTPLFDHAATAPATNVQSAISATVQPYSTAQHVTNGESVNLIWVPLQGIPLLIAYTPCSAMFGGFSFNSFNTIPGPSAPAPEVNAEIVPYSDPFPADWLRMFNVCSSASVAVPIPGTSDVENFQLINGQSTLLPTAPVTPIISPVQNPKINGNDLFAANTISAAAALTLSWSPPAIGSPYGYVIQIAGLTTLPGPGGSGPPQTEYLMRASLGTAKTSITVPPGIMPAGNSYLISITAVVDGKANMETSPHRSMLPVASANILSAVQTIGSTGQ